MTSSTLLGIICGSAAIIVLLVVLIVTAVQNSRKRKAITPPTAVEVAVKPGSTVTIKPAPVSQSVPVQPVVQAAQPVQPEVILPVAIPEEKAVEAVKQVDEIPLLSKDIVSKLKDLPPVQAEIEKSKLVGAKVEWTLYFSSLMLKAQGKVEVTLLNEGNNYPAVSFLADYNQYPQLRNPQWGMPITVKGTIESVYSMYIVLGDVDLSFPQ